MIDKLQDYRRVCEREGVRPYSAHGHVGKVVRPFVSGILGTLKDLGPTRGRLVRFSSTRARERGPAKANIPVAEFTD